MPKQVQVGDIPRYSCVGVQIPSGFEGYTSFERLYAEEIFQQTALNWHIATFYHLFRLRGAENVHYIKGQRIVSHGDALLFINHDILQRYSCTHNNQGDVLLFGTSFFAALPDKSEFLSTAQLFRNDWLLIPIDGAEFKRKVDLYFSLILSDTEPNSRRLLKLTRNWLHNLLIEIEREYTSRQTLLGALMVVPDYVLQFENLLDEHFAVRKQVGWYAGQMSIPEQRLSRLVKEKYGITAKDMINERLVSEAVVMLENTTLNQGEIAALLGFDFTYFVKFFRRHMGITPAKYRSNREE